MSTRLSLVANRREKCALTALLASVLALVGCGSHSTSGSPGDPWSPGSDDTAAAAGSGTNGTGTNGTGTNGTGPSGSGTTSHPVAPDIHPSWLVGTYVDPGKVEDNISSGQKSIQLAADGTYTGSYCKSCGNQPGKWSLVDDELVFDGGSFNGSASLSDFTTNCRILSYSNTRFFRDSVVPNCPLGGGRAMAEACGVVGTYQATGTGNVSNSVFASVEPDFFWYAEQTHTYCVSNQFGSKCLNSTNYDMGTWSTSGGNVVGPPTSGLTFRQEDCASYGDAVTNGTAGASGVGGANGGGASAGAGGASGSGSGGASAASGGASGGAAGASAGAGGSSAGSAGGGSAAGSGSGGAAGSSSGGAAGSGSGGGAGGAAGSGGASAGGASSSGGASSGGASAGSGGAAGGGGG